MVDLINDNENEISEMENLVDEISRDKNLLTILDDYDESKKLQDFPGLQCDWTPNGEKMSKLFIFMMYDFGFVYVFFQQTA